MRQPCTVLVFPFQRTDSGLQYAVFRRSDDSSWQSVSGGVEDDEDMPTAARRETAEETGFARTNPLYKLVMTSGVGRTCFAASAYWPADLYIVPKHFFAMDVSAESVDVVLSHEHDRCSWSGYDEAYAALRYDDDKTALWELNTRLLHDDLPDPIG